MHPSSTALVTGCSSGIGRATALALHAAGWPVVATARRVESITELQRPGLRALALDVTDESSMRAAVAAVEAEHGTVGVLVNNAGYALQAPVEEAPLAEVRRQFETNVFGLVRLTQLVLPGMRAQRWGRIVNIGSMGGRFTLPGGGFYHATKYAVEALSDALRLEAASFGVAVVLVQPGPVATAFADTAVSSLEAHPSPYAGFRTALADRLTAAYAGGRRSGVVTADDVARVVVRAVRSDRPRPRYAVGTLARTAITARRLLPDQVWDALLRRSYPTP